MRNLKAIIMRIIRSIRVEKDIWERAKTAVRQNKQYISHYIEERLHEYIGKNNKENNNNVESK